MKKNSLILFICIALLFLTSCGTLFNSTHQAVKFDSEPTGARVYDNGTPIGKTPLAASMIKKKDHVIEFKLDGYESVTKLIEASAGAGFVILDIFLGGIIGVAVDAITQGWNGLDTDYLKVSMERD